MKKIGRYIRKEYDKFKKKKWYGKLLDLLFVVLLVLLLIPSTRKGVMTYASKVRMYLTPVEEKEEKVSITGTESLQFADAGGNRYALDQYLDKPVFINYWATWCPPCRAEMPGLEKLYRQYGDKINFLFISNQKMSKQQEFIQKNGYELPVYQLLSRPGGTFQYSALPTSLIISKDNKVVMRKEGAVNWQSKKIRAIFDRVAGAN